MGSLMVLVRLSGVSEASRSSRRRQQRANAEMLIPTGLQKPIPGAMGQ